jgi:hypothetical protein
MKEVRMECLRTPYVVPWHSWPGRCPSTRTPARPRGHECFTPGNFKKDAIVRPSHGRPRGHRPTVRTSVRYRPRDNPKTGWDGVARREGEGKTRPTGRVARWDRDVAKRGGVA